MRALTKTPLTLGAVLLTAFGLTAVSALIMLPGLHGIERRLAAESGRLAENRARLTLKAGLEKEWDAKKIFLPPAGSQNDALNLWIRDLTAYARDQGLAFERVEPRGEDLLIAFTGSFRDLTRFIYYLLEKDPFARLRDLRLRQSETPALFACEITLRRSFLE